MALRYGWLGFLPVIRELRQLRELATEIGHEIRHQLLPEIREIRQLVRPLRDAAVIAAQDAVLLTAERYADPRSLTRHQAQVYSRHAEDGIIAEIFRRIGTVDRRFVEIGVDTGVENNTRLLLQLGWTGAWLEGSADNARAIRDLFGDALASGQLTLVNALVTRENAARLLEQAGLGSEFDFLSIDIDMNTHHIWESLAAFRPRVACIEYNSSIPPSVDFAVPYQAEAAWTDGSNYFGAGLKTLERIGRQLGYNLVACDYLGVDAFFVRTDLCEDRFLEPFTAEFHYEPPRYGLHGHRGHKKFKS